MSIETDKDFTDIIPWEYTSTKLDKDVETISKIKEEGKISFCISSRKGWLTQAFNRVKNDDEFNKKFNLKGTQTHNRYKDTLHFLEERMGMIVNIYRRYLQLFPLLHQDTLEAFNKLAETYWHSRDILDKLLDSVNSSFTTAPVSAPFQNDSVPKVASELKPNLLTENSMPQSFVDWTEKLQVYFSANKLLARPISEQIQYARSFMSSQLWHLVRDKITPDMPVFKDRMDTTYVEYELNSLIEVLDKEFLRLYPTITRRLEIFKKRQRAEQSSLAFASELKRDALAGNLSAITEEDIICILLLNGLSNESLRREILDAFDIEDKLSISELEHEIRKWEANRRTNNYVQGRSTNELFKMSTYKKQKNFNKKAKANSLTCHKCGKPGHIAPRCNTNIRPSRTSSRTNFQRPSRPSFRPRGQSFSRSSRSKSQPTYRSQKPKRVPSLSPAPRYRKNNLLRSLTQEADNTFEIDESGKFVNYCRALTDEHDFIDGFSHGVATPRISVSLTPLGPKDVRGDTFEIQCTPDTGATRSVAPLTLAQQCQFWMLSAENENLKNASMESMPLAGCSHVEITYKNVSVKVYVLVTPLVNTLFLSWHDLLNLKILTMDLKSATMNNFNHVTDVSDKDNSLDEAKVSNDSLEQIIKDFSDVINDELPTKPIKDFEMKIHLDESKPIPKSPYIAGRSRPLALEPLAHADVLQMIKKDIIERATEPSEFNHIGFHSLKPNGSVRFLVDFSTGVNKCLRRQIHPFVPGTQLLQRVLKSSSVFAVFDAVSGYFQISLHKDSRKYTTFVIPEGRFVFKRCPQGLSSSSDTFVDITNQIFSGLEGVLRLIDDICIQAPDYITLFYRIRKFLLKCREYNIGISRKKIQCGEKVRFSGHIVSSTGILMDPQKVKALAEMPRPKDKTDCKSFLGLLGTFSSFYAEIAEIRQPLCQLLKKDVKFHWNEILQKSFDDCKKLLLQNKRIISPFDPKLDTYCFTDGSRIGMGFAVCQFRDPNQKDIKLLMCGSRNLVPAEVSYGCTDLEMTAASWSICKASYFLRGLHHFYLMVDHKALVNIFSKSLSSVATPRQLRIRQKLIGYNFTTVYIKGSSNTLSDTLSRLPCEPPSKEDVLEAEASDATANICNHMTNHPKLINPMLDDLIKAAKADPNYRMVIKMIKDGVKQEQIRNLTSDHPAKILAKDWNNLSVLEDLLIYEGHRIVVPKSCRRKILNLLHIPHAGISKTRTAARELYWWPKYSVQISQMISACEECIRYRPVCRQAPFKPIISRWPMERLASDPFHYSGKTYLATKCAYSGWLWCHKMKDITSETVIEVLDSIMLSFGKCMIFQSDNGPCFRSTLFKEYLEKNGIIHETSSSYHAAGNGQIEIGCKILKILIKKAKADWKVFLVMLREFNNYPRQNGFSPSDIMFGRRQKTELPALSLAFNLKGVKDDDEEKRSSSSSSYISEKLSLDAANKSENLLNSLVGLGSLEPHNSSRENSEMQINDNIGASQSIHSSAKIDYKSHCDTMQNQHLPTTSSTGKINHDTFQKDFDCDFLAKMDHNPTSADYVQSLNHTVQNILANLEPVFPGQNVLVRPNPNVGQFDGSGSFYYTSMQEPNYGGNNMVQQQIEVGTSAVVQPVVGTSMNQPNVAGPSVARPSNLEVSNAVASITTNNLVREPASKSFGKKTKPDSTYLKPRFQPQKQTKGNQFSGKSILKHRNRFLGHKFQKMETLAQSYKSQKKKEAELCDNLLRYVSNALLQNRAKKATLIELFNPNQARVNGYKKKLNALCHRFSRKNRTKPRKFFPQQKVGIRDDKSVYHEGTIIKEIEHVNADPNNSQYEVMLTDPAVKTTRNASHIISYESLDNLMKEDNIIFHCTSAPEFVGTQPVKLDFFNGRSFSSDSVSVEEPKCWELNHQTKTMVEIPTQRKEESLCSYIIDTTEPEDFMNELKALCGSAPMDLTFKKPSSRTGKKGRKGDKSECRIFINTKLTKSHKLGKRSENNDSGLANVVVPCSVYKEVTFSNPPQSSSDC